MAESLDEQEHQTLLRTVLLISSSFSIVGCTFIIITWISIPKLRYMSRRLILYMSVADLLSSIAFAAGAGGIGEQVDSSGTLCLLQGYLLEFGYLASYLWTACFSFHLYQMIVRRHPKPDAYFNGYHIVSWGLPAGFDIFLLCRQLAGADGMGTDDRPWCWIADFDERGARWGFGGAIMQFIFFYFPVICVFGFNLTIYIKLWRHMRSHTLPVRERIQVRLFWYMTAFLFCSLWGFLNRCVQALRSDHQASNALSLLEVAFGPFQGFLNAVVYGMNDQIWSVYKDCCRSTQGYMLSIGNGPGRLGRNNSLPKHTRPLLVDDEAA